MQPLIQEDAVAPLVLAQKLQGRFRLLGPQGFTGIAIAAIDMAAWDAINKYSKLDLPVTPTLWLEFHGTEASVVEQAEMVQKITAGHGGANFSRTTRPEDRKKLWRARHDVVYADRALRPGGQKAWTEP